MKHLAAYCLLVLGGNASPSEEDVANLLKECGVTCDKDNCKTMIAQVGSASVPEHIKAGQAKMATVGGGAAAGPAAAGGAAAAVAEAEKEPEVEEEEVDMDMGGMFGGDDDY